MTQKTNTFNSIEGKAVIAVAIAAIMMLFALSLDWYTIRLTHFDENIIIQLDNERNLDPSLLLKNDDLDWISTDIPVIAAALFASTALVLAMITFIRGTIFKPAVWILIGGLSISALIAGFVCLFVQVFYFDIEHCDDSSPYITPDAGWIIAFLAAILMIIAGISTHRSRKTTEDIEAT